MSLRFGIITASDRSAHGERADDSGPTLSNAVIEKNWLVMRTLILPDEFDQLRDVMAAWADSGEMDVILVTGGTGFAPRDITPEATLAVVDKLTPGLPEAMRAASLRITPFAMLSRLQAGIRKRTLIINLPGSPKGALENLQVVMPVLEHAVALMRDENAGH